MCSESPQAVLDFWFGGADSTQRGARREVWFKQSEAFDQAVRDRFLRLYERSERGELTAWEDALHSLLALIIVQDQFPRDMFRNSARAFATDRQALAATELMVGRGWDNRLEPVERWFVYMPYEHAEDLAMQERSLELFARLAEHPGLADVLEWARKHHAVIARFGRFPHRNAMLGRVSTPEELEFLAQPGSSF